MSQEEIKQEQVEQTQVETQQEQQEQQEVNEQVEVNGTQDKQQEQGTEDKQDEKKPIPYDRFKQKVDEVKSLKAQLEALQNQASQSETVSTQLSEYETQLASLKSENEQYQSMVNEMLESKLSTIPDELKELIPEGSATSKIKWIDSAIAKGLFNVNKPQSFGNKGINPVEQETTREQFLKMSYKERAKLKSDNKELYERLLKK